MRDVQANFVYRAGVALDRALARVLMACVRLYQITLSPWIGGQCRFHPTCSHYSMGALAQHGAVRGTWLTIKRLGKCHPYHPGGVDEVPSPHKH